MRHNFKFSFFCILHFHEFMSSNAVSRHSNLVLERKRKSGFTLMIKPKLLFSREIRQNQREISGEISLGTSLFLCCSILLFLRLNFHPSWCIEIIVMTLNIGSCKIHTDFEILLVLQICSLYTQFRNYQLRTNFMAHVCTQ